VALVAIVGSAAAGWFIVVKPLWQAGSELVEVGKQWAQVAELDATVRNTTHYSPPTQDRLDANAVGRFIAVQSAIEQALDGQLAGAGTEVRSTRQARQAGRPRAEPD
jgi:hypothetical protein